MKNNLYLYLLIMIVVTNLVRILPVTLMRKPIKNRRIRSFLYYIPYVTLAVMTFPAIMHATLSPVAGIVAFLVGIVAAWLGLGLFIVSITCCVAVFLIEFF